MAEGVADVMAVAEGVRVAVAVAAVVAVIVAEVVLVVVVGNKEYKLDLTLNIGILSANPHIGYGIYAIINRLRINAFSNAA